ncbi:hypothetical protein Sjap_020471 [Stephania japonica]|uniref:Uncharacterized protein n=1 Tax=Stephania japonica TaxID=461633 RepID=A0AAP0F6A1_9MAGN
MHTRYWQESGDQFSYSQSDGNNQLAHRLYVPSRLSHQINSRLVRFAEKLTRDLHGSRPGVPKCIGNLGPSQFVSELKLSTDPETRFRYRIEITDQRGLNDDSGTSSPRAVSIEEFRTLTQRVAAQERQLEEILVILRASVVAASVPSTARITVTQEANTPVVTTTATLPTTTAAKPVMAVVPHAPTEIVPTTPVVYGTTTTTEARQQRETRGYALGITGALYKGYDSSDRAECSRGKGPCLGDLL